MKKIKKISIVAVILILSCMFFVSCGEKEDALAPAIGSWTMTEVEYAGQTLSADDLKSTGAMTEMPTFEIKDGGSCTFNFMDTSGAGEVKVNDDGTFQLTDDSEETIPFEIDDSGKLRLNYEAMNMVMIFEK